MPRNICLACTCFWSLFLLTDSVCADWLFILSGCWLSSSLAIPMASTRARFSLAIQSLFTAMRPLHKLTGRPPPTGKRNSHKERRERRAKKLELEISCAANEPKAMTIPIAGRAKQATERQRGWACEPNDRAIRRLTVRRLKACSSTGPLAGLFCPTRARLAL